MIISLNILEENVSIIFGGGSKHIVKGSMLTRVNKSNRSDCYRRSHIHVRLFGRYCAAKRSCVHTFGRFVFLRASFSLTYE